MFGCLPDGVRGCCSFFAAHTVQTMLRRRQTSCQRVIMGKEGATGSNELRYKASHECTQVGFVNASVSKLTEQRRWCRWWRRCRHQHPPPGTMPIPEATASSAENRAKLAHGDDDNCCNAYQIGVRRFHYEAHPSEGQVPAPRSRSRARDLSLFTKSLLITKADPKTLTNPTTSPKYLHRPPALPARTVYAYQS